jgi:hypothetical protein
MDADAVELRVLGCLLEKQRVTPDQYPLSLNALRLAANQTTNREPVGVPVRVSVIPLGWWEARNRSVDSALDGADARSIRS